MKNSTTSFFGSIHRRASLLSFQCLILIFGTLISQQSSAQLVVLQPSGPGITMTSNGNYTAIWNRGNTAFTKVRIKLSIDGGLTFPYLLQSNTNSNSTDSSEAFRVPGLPTTMARIRITDQNDSTIGDMSDNNFTITGYCWPWGTVCTNNAITNVVFNTISNASTCTAPSFTVNPKAGSRTTTVQRGLGYSFSTTVTSATGGVGVWCDFNNDLDFDDPNEFLFASTSLGTTHSGTITIPNSASIGDRRLRVRTINNRIPVASDFCTQYSQAGETEDYIITITQPIITVAGVVPTSCAGGTLSVNFTTSGTFKSGNEFQVQLSAPGGLFGPGTTVLARGTSAPISTVIRLGTIAGNYRLRVAATNPETFGTPTNLFAVREKPTGPTAASVSRCGPGTLALSASGCALTRWYDSPDGTNQIGTGLNFTTPVLGATTNYYVGCMDFNGCGSIRTTVTAAIKDLPSITNITPNLGTVDFDEIVISGNGFQPLDSVRFFNGKRSSVVDNLSPTSFTTKAPIGTATGPITVYNSCGSATSSGNFTPIVPVIEDPEIVMTSGTYPSAITTEIFTNTFGADIYYTLNGSNPVVGTTYTKLYEGEVFIGTNLTLKAIGYRNGWVTSGVSAATYTITSPTLVAQPTITPPTGSYSGGQLVTMACATPQSTIYFTTNGQLPRPGINNPVRYLGPFTRIDPFVALKAVATRDGWANSPVRSVNLTITGGTALSACSFSPAPGVYGSSQSVTISNPDPSASIYYTLDGTDPFIYNPLATLYTGPVTVSKTSTLKAQAFRSGFGDSPRTTGNYTIGVLRAAVDVIAEPALYTFEETDVYGQSFGAAEEPGSEWLKEVNLKSDLRVQLYPNPTTGNVFIDYGAAMEDVKITITNMLGREIRVEQTSGISFGAALSLANQPAGFYSVRIENRAGERIEKRLIVN